MGLRAVPASKGGGGGKYSGASPTTNSVGGLPAGSAVTGKTANQILESILVSYQAPAFTGFQIDSQANQLELGQTISGSKDFSFSLANAGNVNPNTLTITDVTLGLVRASGRPFVSPQAASIGAISHNVLTYHSWQASGVNNKGQTFLSPLYSIGWFPRLYAGTSTNTSLTAAQIQALVQNGLSSGKNGLYSFAAGGYKYFAWPDSFGSPTAATGFKDTATNLAVAMAEVTDNAAYSNTENGWSYAIVSVTNAYGVTLNYRVYRTRNVLGGAINILVS